MASTTSGDSGHEQRSITELIELQSRGRMHRRYWLAPAIFLSVFFLLQYGWQMIAGSRIGRWYIENVTVGTSVALINSVIPSAEAHREGASIQAPCCRLNVRNGCEGTELLFLLVAALVAYPFVSQSRGLGLAAGSILMFFANQARTMSLFACAKSYPPLFGPVHDVVAPLCLMMLMLLFFVWLQRWDSRRKVV